MKELLLWLYGKSARNAHIRDMAEKTIVLLKEKGSMEYQELAKALGVIQVTIARWETGVRKIPVFLPLALETLARRKRKRR